MEGWVVELTAVLPTGNLQQLYPNYTSAGVNPATATNGQSIRRPCEGTMYNLQIRTDGVNGGYLELWDVSGAQVTDVSSATTITDAQLTALIALGVAKMIYTQNFSASSLTPFNAYPRGFQRGLAARYVNYTENPDTAVGSCLLNLVVQGGFQFTTKVG